MLTFAFCSGQVSYYKLCCLIIALGCSWGCDGAILGQLLLDSCTSRARVNAGQRLVVCNAHLILRALACCGVNQWSIAASLNGYCHEK